MPAEPYQDTTVSVVRSQAAIERLLADAGALGVRFGAGFRRLQVDEEAAPDPCVVEFIWKVPGGQQIVRLAVTPKPHEPKPWSSRSTGGWKVSQEQRERQAWRGLYWYLEGTLKAATFGLIRFEDVFLSFIVAGDDPSSPTIGEMMIDRLQSGGRAIALLDAGEVLDGEVVS